MQKLWVPETVDCISIYADNDAHSEYKGQSSAFILAGRLKREAGRTGRRRVEVYVPKIAGADWADVWLSRVQRSGEKAA